MKFLGLSLLLIILSYSICQPSQAKQNGWILTQHSKIFGDQYIYISTHGVKCVNPKQGVGWVTQTPNWNITFFNEKTKLYYPLSASNWRNKIARNGLIPNNVHWSKIGSGSIAGLKASQYKMTNSTQTEKSSNSKWVSATYWLADDINVPPSLAQLISAACGLPTSDSIPLQLSYCNQSGNTQTLLTTYNQQSTSIPDSYFSVFSGYKLAKSEVEVLISQENRALLNDLANDLSGSGTKNLSPELINASKQISPESINKLPDQVALPGGKTVSKDQINKFLDSIKQNRQ
jgi:hypothetical protein